MSELKLISPMLDNYIVGDPFSDHNGVRCCPAMEKNSDDKYIVKVISVPASENQLNALLLTGAFTDQESALSYFKELAEGHVGEAEILRDLSRLEGFVPYENWQMVSMDDGTGYDVYLISRYHKTLEHHFRRSFMTHLGAINLGLDMCAALAVARRSGYLYVDLKPSNIVLSADNEYRISDIGFLSLDSLKYASLPEIYRSQYTAPEISDAFASINTTVDVYAAGLIMYQAYNDGKLPSMENLEDMQAFPPPAYADYEMSDIILKACALRPEDRWQDPVEMGQALVSYMQRNGANDTPVIPDAPSTEANIESYEPVYADSETNIDEVTNIENINIPTDDAPIEDEVNIDEVPYEEVTESDTVDLAAENELVSEVITDIDATSEDSYENLSFLEDISEDETTPDYLEEDVSYSEVTNEVSDILEQADDLLSHPTPEPVIPPEPIDVPIPPPIVLDEPDPESETVETVSTEDPQIPEENKEEPQEDSCEIKSGEPQDNADEDYEQEQIPKRNNRWIIGIFAFILTAALLFVGFYYYRNFYLQPVSIDLDGSENALTVYVNSHIDESKLTVVCIDTYGNQLTQKVKNGKAEFTNLAANSAYTVKINIDGFHRLTGNTSSAYTTPVQTNIAQFTAIAGAEDGSVRLNFAVDGPDSDNWSIRYWADGEDEKSAFFSGHMITLTQLTIGKEYTFVLDSEDDLFLSGDIELKHTPLKFIKAENLKVTSCSDNKLTATWDAPEGSIVTSWTVRCYNDNGFDKTVTVTETNVTFEEIDSTSGYTIKVTAAGMSEGVTALISANALTITNIQAEFPDPLNLILKWDSNLSVSDAGWVVMYSVNGATQQEITCKENRLEISPYVPGAAYSFKINAVDGAEVFGGAYDCTAEKPGVFSGYGVSGQDMDFYLCRRPENEDWDIDDLSGNDYVVEFTPSEKISFAVDLDKEHEPADKEINIFYIIKDSNGSVVNTSSHTDNWNTMWKKNEMQDKTYCYLDLPYTPSTPGAYTVTIYFNNFFVKNVNFTILNPS